MRKKYLLRLDDACPTMDTSKWTRIEAILDKYKIKPMVGVIPHNMDPKQQIEIEDPNFWEKVKHWQNKGWSIAMHGFNHLFESDGGLEGINPMWKRSEFSGLPLEKQRKKIKDGLAIMKENGVVPHYFFAPAHTFDNNTILALKEESDIRVISDTIALRPYKYGGFIIIPQFGGMCREMKMSGMYTFCLHPNVMDNKAFESTEAFLVKHSVEFIGFDEIGIEEVKSKSLLDYLINKSYFLYRAIRGQR